MGFLPSWIVNAKDCIVEVIDDELDYIKEGARCVEGSLYDCQKYLKDNTWKVVYVPSNFVLSVVKKPAEIINDISQTTDDYFFENEKRSIEIAEHSFIQNEKQNIENEEKRIQQLQEDAEKYADEELKHLMNTPSQTRGNESSVKQTLREAGIPINKNVVSVMLDNQIREA